MRRILIAFVAVMWMGSVVAQKENDNTPGGSDRLVLELNWNGWMDSPDSIDVQWYSRGINMYFMYDLKFGKSPISIAPGLGFGVDNIYHTGQFLYNDSITMFLPINDSVEYKKNKLTTTYVDIPLELRYRSKPDGRNYSIKAGVGIKAGLLLGSHTKYVGEGRSFGAFQEEVKVKEHNVPELSKFRYGLTARIGYGPFNLQAFYGLSGLFNEGLGPAMKPISIGLSFNGL